MRETDPGEILKCRAELRQGMKGNCRGAVWLGEGFAEEVAGGHPQRALSAVMWTQKALKTEGCSCCCRYTDGLDTGASPDVVECFMWSTAYILDPLSKI